MRVFRLGAVLLAMLGTLAFAGSAYAGVRADPLGTPEVLEPEGAQSGPGAGKSPEGGATPSGEEQHETPPIVEEPKESPPVLEEHLESPPPVVGEHLESPPPPVGEHPEVPPIVEKHPENTPTVTVLGESPETPPATGQGTEEAAKGLHTGQGSEGGSASSRTLVSPDSTLAQPALAHSAATEESAAALLGLPPTVGGPQTQASATPAAGVVVAGARAAMTAAQRAGALSCQLTALGGRRPTTAPSAGWAASASPHRLSASSPKPARWLLLRRLACPAATIMAALPAETRPSVRLPDRRRAAPRARLSAGGRPVASPCRSFSRSRDFCSWAVRARCAGCGFHVSRG